MKKYFDMAFDGEPVIVSRKENKNAVIISEAEYNELAKAKRNTGDSVIFKTISSMMLEN